MGEWLRTGEVARRVGRTREWVRRACEEGDFEGALFRKQWRIPTEAVEAHEEKVRRITARVIRRRRPKE